MSVFCTMASVSRLMRVVGEAEWGGEEAAVGVLAGRAGAALHVGEGALEEVAFFHGQQGAEVVPHAVLRPHVLVHFLRGAGKGIRNAGLGLLLPLGHKARVDAVLAGQLADAERAGERLKGDLCLEFCRETVLFA